MTFYDRRQVRDNPFLSERLRRLLGETFRQPKPYHQSTPNSSKKPVQRVSDPFETSGPESV